MGIVMKKRTNQIVGTERNLFRSICATLLVLVGTLIGGAKAGLLSGLVPTRDVTLAGVTLLGGTTYQASVERVDERS